MTRLSSKLILLSGVAVLALASCYKTEVKAILTMPATTPQLTASSSAVVLDSTQDTETAVTFTWPQVKYGYNADVTYTLQFDTPTDSFKNATDVVVGVNAYSLSYTTANFNLLAYQTLGLAPGAANPIVVRVKIDVNKNGAVTGPSTVSSVYSNTYTMTVNPFKIVIVYPSIWVPGDYQGWNPLTAPILASVHANGVYEGYINIPPGGTYQFKMTPAPDWNNSFGWVASTVSAGSVTGTMSLSAGGNLFVPAGGYYYMNASTNPTPATWSATLITGWSVIGDATPGGWTTDTPMAYDTTSNTWSVTVYLVSTGAFKFRANDAWTINFGFDNGALDYNGSNLPVPPTGSGTYNITLDLSSAGNYVYRIKAD